MKQEIVIYWARRDFRLIDNPALFESLKYSKEKNLEFLPLYIIDPAIISTEKNNIGINRKKILAFILANFSKEFQQFRIFCGKPVDIFNELLKTFKIHLFFNDDIEPYAIQRDMDVAKKLEMNGSKTRVLKDQLTVDKLTVSQLGTIYTVFTPFKNAVLSQFLNAKSYPKANLKNINLLLPATIEKIKLTTLNLLAFTESTDNLQSMIFSTISSDLDNFLFFENRRWDLSNLLSKSDISYYLQNEADAINNFTFFLNNKILNYKISRDSLEDDADNNSRSTSKMSMALKWGLISSRTIKDMISAKFSMDEISINESVSSYISELIWREFYKYLLYHFPESLNVEFQTKYRYTIPWVTEDVALQRFKAWIYGQTGYRIVDAAMNQIVKEGWMHNRSRMIVASILSKNLGIDWRWGQEYFRLLLVDLDEASNNGGWQWAASVGADPKPIRIFNPYLQAEKFDKTGKYQKKWLPEGYNLNQPIIEHSLARNEAIKRYRLTPNKTEVTDKLF